MKLSPLSALLLFATHAAHAAITITVLPDGSGGTTFTFTQTSPNPAVPTGSLLGGTFLIELPPGMFSTIIIEGGPSSDITGSFASWATFVDAGSGVTYGVTSLRIAGDLTSADLGFHRAFFQSPGQTESQFELLPGTPAASTISPLALVEGSHSIASVLFGTVTVNVVPEPSGLSLLSSAGLAFAMRRRRAARNVEPGIFPQS